MSIPTSVKIVEVGPRDGLQNEAVAVPAGVKIKLIEKLVEAGLRVVESGSFVAPAWVPQMATSAEVFQGMTKKPGVSYPMLTPNLKGLELAIAAGVEEVAIFPAASETFSKTNINCSIDEAIERFRRVAEEALRANMRVRGYISCVLGCPYEGRVAPQVVADMAQRLIDMGCYELSLGDTIGVGTPGQTRDLIELIVRQIAVERLAGHFHDTYGQGLANVYAALECGVAVFDSSIAGLGGCPYARGATGNIATEDVLYMLDGMHIETGIDMQKLLDAGIFINDFLGRETASRAARALIQKRSRQETRDDT